MNRNKFDFNALDNAERDMIMRMIGRVQTEAEHDIKNAGYDPFSCFQRYNPGKEPYKMLIVRMTELGHALMNDRNDLKPCIDVNESYDYIMRMHNRSNNPINIREYNDGMIPEICAHSIMLVIINEMLPDIRRKSVNFSKLCEEANGMESRSFPITNLNKKDDNLRIEIIEHIIDDLNDGMPLEFIIENNVSITDTGYGRILRAFRRDLKQYNKEKEQGYTDFNAARR